MVTPRERVISSPVCPFQGRMGKGGSIRGILMSEVVFVF